MVVVMAVAAAVLAAILATVLLLLRVPQGGDVISCWILKL